MWPKTISLFAVVSSLAVIVPATVAAKSPAALKREVSSLHHRNATLKRKLTTARSDNADLLGQLTYTRSVVDGQAAQITQISFDKGILQNQLNDAVASRDNALRGLPDAIKAVPFERRYELLFYPIRDRPDICGSFYSSGSYWSVTFDPPIGGSC